MTKSKILKYTTLVFFICAVYFFSASIIEESFRKKVMSKRKMYCYEQFDKNAVNPILYVEHERYFDSLIIYYQKMGNGNMSPTFNFPINSMPFDTCVYVMGYEYDSLIVDVICYYDWGNVSDVLISN